MPIAEIDSPQLFPLVVGNGSVEAGNSLEALVMEGNQDPVAGSMDVGLEVGEPE